MMENTLDFIVFILGCIAFMSFYSAALLTILSISYIKINYQPDQQAGSGG
jgi:hypothetical protein